MKNSPFLKIKKIHENDFAFSFFDNYPVSEGHMLVVPKRVVAEIFDLSEEEYKACFELVREVRDYLSKKFML